MFIKKYVLIFIILLNTLSYGNEFERSEELPYLLVTNAKLVEDANSIFAYISTLNGENVETKGTIELHNDEISTTLDFPVINKDFKFFPIKSYDANIRIVSYKGTIQSFYIRLSDYERKITSTGNNLNNVVATLNVAKEKLEKHEVGLTGKSFRILLFFLILAVILVALFIAFNILKEFHSYLFFGIIFISGQFALYGLDWDKYFPGFEASITAQSLLERSSPLLSLIGVLLAIFVPLFPFIKNTPQTDQDTDKKKGRKKL